MSRYLSTLQRMTEENKRLRRNSEIDRAVFWACIVVFAVIAFMRYYLGWRV